ncbi:hypothetical protein ACS0TY_015589 [Phlomoides rotata]
MASSSCAAAATPSNILTGRKRVIGELSRGRAIADQLRLILRETGVDGPVSAQNLVGKILDTFTQSLSMLSAGAGGDSDEVSQVPVVVNSPAMKSEDSGDSCKTPASKDRRGCYKRKKTSVSWSKETPTSFDDGHAWRKYGQKAILKAKYPRNYFRCTHKFDQGCPALKQVQQIDDDPPKVRTTYHGNHTCNSNLHKSAHQIIIDATTQDHSSIIWSFNSPGYNKPDTGFVFHNLTEDQKGPIKQENDECYISPDLTVPFDAAHLGAFSSGSDPGDVMSSDVYSCTASTHDSIDMDHMMVGTCNIDDFLDEFESLS